MKKTAEILEQVAKDLWDPLRFDLNYNEKQATEAMRRCSMEFAEWRSINAFQWGRLWRLYDEENRKNYTTAELFKLWEEAE